MHDLFEQPVQVGLGIREVERAGLDFRQVEDIVDQLQQQVVVVLDDADILLFLLFCIGGGENVREPDDCVERGTDLVAHVCEERAFQTTGLFGFLLGRNQFLLHLFADRDHQRRADQCQRFAGSVAGIHGSLYFHPVEVRTAGVGHAVLFADFRDFPLNQVPVGLFDAFAVLFVYFGEIGRFGHRKSVLVDILATHQFHRTVYVA